MLSGTLAAYGLPFKKQVVVTADRTLSTQELNGLIVVNSAGGPVTITLPPANTIRAGGFFQILALNGSVNPVTVAVQPGNTYNDGLAASIVLDQSAQSLIILGTEAATTWLAILDLGGGGGTGQHNVGYVDLVNGDDATGAIGTLKPFKTIQAFINAVPSGDDSAGARNVFTAQIAPGDYDEDLAIDISRRRIVLTGPGSWNLGLFNGADWSPTNARNIVVTGAQANVDGIRPGLVITNNLPLTEAWTTHQSYLTRPRISGRIDLSGIGGIGSIELGLTCEIFDQAATGQAIEAGAAIIQSYLYHCRMRAGVHGTNWNFQQAFYSRFQGLIDVSGFSLIDTCRIDAGLTTLAGPPVGITPSGMVNTNFSGTFTGPAGSAAMDGFTNYWFKANGALLGGAATKTITDDLVP